MNRNEIKKAMKDTNLSVDQRLRALANYPNWYLVVDKNNCAVLWEFDGKKTIAVMTERKSPDKVTREFLEMRGLHLMANLPDETQMIAFDLSQDNAVCLNGEGITRLKNIAGALRCEEQLAAPPVPSTVQDVTDRVEHVLSLEWIVLWDQNKPLVMDYKGLKGIMLFTAFDTVDAFMATQGDATKFELAHLSGQKLFKILDAQDDYDGVYVNAASSLELFPFAPAQMNELAKGRQPRPERKVLRARSEAELQHYLDECGMAAERPAVTERVQEQDVVHYTGAIMPGLEQRSFRFYPLADNSPADKLGEGASEIVCAGKLADLIRRRLELLADEPRPLSDDMKKFARSTLTWVNELMKLHDPKTCKLPRHALRTVDGARFVREYPEIASTNFAESALRSLTI